MDGWDLEKKQLKPWGKTQKWRGRTEKIKDLKILKLGAGPLRWEDFRESKAGDPKLRV